MVYFISFSVVSAFGKVEGGTGVTLRSSNLFSIPLNTTRNSIVVLGVEKTRKSIVVFFGKVGVANYLA